jgi:hypothetical protein
MSTKMMRVLSAAIYMSKFTLQDFEREMKKYQEGEGKRGACNEVQIGESFADYVQHRPV